jgi:SAM-dependent methyltransferase
MPPQTRASTFDILTQWFDSDLGRYLLTQQQRILTKELQNRFGYHFLQLSCCDLPVFEGSTINHSFCAASHRLSQDNSVISNHEALPISGESIDLALIHHTHEFSENPHQLLREVSRVLIAGGHIVICGFNPLSVWGARRFIPWKRHAGPWYGKAMTIRRLSDWLKLLDFKVQSVTYGGYCLPVNAKRLIRYSSALDGLAGIINWPTGGFYIITARKQVAPLNLIKSHGKERFPVGVGIPVAEKVAKPCQREKHRECAGAES